MDKNTNFTIYLFSTMKIAERSLKKLKTWLQEKTGGRRKSFPFINPAFRDDDVIQPANDQPEPNIPKVKKLLVVECDILRSLG